MTILRSFTILKAGGFDFQQEQTYNPSKKKAIPCDDCVFSVFISSGDGDDCRQSSGNFPHGSANTAYEEERGDYGYELMISEGVGMDEISKLSKKNLQSSRSFRSNNNNNQVG